ncbi:transcriptional regulator FilR1 domain-containing protein [Natrialba sp. SSL1]|uniref:transcriptional regulator FilR1 domain-containing protein n=1 Tax=Natrialba sp. SSL1 TaxID=1869245 RepID=UPI001495B40A|nr:transcriptional regulator FilR1 domain-containing protein [Natrialba sp. SSL1]
MATNPLTDEQFVVREFISDLVGSTCLGVLRSLDGRSSTASAIEEHGEVTRQTASKHLSQLSESGLTKSMSDGEYRLTAGGKAVLDAFDTSLDEIDRTQLTNLTRSKHTIPLLLTISNGAARPSELVGTNDSAPSRATVQRAVRMFETEEWCKEMSGSYHLTPTGERTLDVYEELAVTLEQVIEKAPWFQRLSPSRTDIPVCELTDAKLYISSPNSPGIVLAAALKLCDPRLDHFRVLTSIFNPTLFRAYDKLLKLGLKGEAVVDESLYDRLHEEEMEHFLDDSNYDNFRISSLDETLTIGIGIYDEKQIAIGAYNETGAGEHIAMLLSSNEAVIQWGIQLFKSYREQACHSAESASEPIQ